jgi:4,5-DOPA dioxygenase extradiol
MPALFLGHGTPMNAIEDNRWSRLWRAIGSTLPRPDAILSISAHWFVPATCLTGNERPETIHDFGGFPDELYRVRYPAPGDPGLAARVASRLESVPALVRDDWGFDHGSWSVLRHLFPGADVPVVQLSIDSRMAPSGHLAIGRMLAPLRDEGVLVMGSGNITHNLRHALSSWRDGESETPEWARRFDADVAAAAARFDDDYFLRALEGESGRMNHPTPDHYLPLLYAYGAADERDAVAFPVAGFDLSSLSMRAILFG